MKTKKSVSHASIVIPAFNESQGLGHTIDAIKKISKNFEILIIDDGSTDNTCQIASQKHVQVIRHSHNRGYGAAIKTGIQHAGNEIIVIIDADATYPPDVIPEMIRHLVSGNRDMVVGVRTGAKVSVPLLRRPAKWIINKIAQRIVGEQIPDLNSGLRIFRKEAVKDLTRLLPDGFSLTTTITLGMILNGYSVEYFPINYFKRKGKSKFRPIADTVNLLQLIFRIGLYFAPLKIFLPLSGFIFILAVIWGLISYFVLGRFADASTLTMVMAAIQVSVIGLLAELVNSRTYNRYEKQK